MNLAGLEAEVESEMEGKTQTPPERQFENNRQKLVVSKGHNKKFTFCRQKYKIKVCLNQQKLPNDSFGFVV